VIGAAGAAGCVCDAGYVGRAFTDLDGQPSITCVPVNAPVDFEADGLDLPDACAGVDCGVGACVDVGGFPTCRCADGAAARLGTTGGVTCGTVITERTGGPGAFDYSEAIADIRVCAPRPPECGETGWLVPSPMVAIRGEACPGTTPTAEQLRIKPRPRCPGGVVPSGISPGVLDERGGGCRGGSCSAGGTGAPYGLLPPLAVGLWLVTRRRRR
jgi:hypothetical protein